MHADAQQADANRTAQPAVSITSGGTRDPAGRCPSTQLTRLVVWVLLVKHHNLAQLALLQLLARVVVGGVQVHQRQQLNQRVADLQQRQRAVGVGAQPAAGSSRPQTAAQAGKRTGVGSAQHVWLVLSGTSTCALGVVLTTAAARTWAHTPPGNG